MKRALGTNSAFPNSSHPSTSSVGKPHVMTVLLADMHSPILLTNTSLHKLRQRFFKQEARLEQELHSYVMVLLYRIPIPDSNT